MNFKSLEQIRKSFGISQDAPEDIRRELRRRLKKIHPDTLSGAQPSAENEPEEVLRLTAALNFLDDSKRRTAVVPVEEVTDLVKAIRDLVPAENKQQETEDRLSQQVDDQIKEARVAGRRPRIFLTAVAAVLTLAWLFPSLTSDNPILNRFINVENPVFNVVWLAVLLYTGAIWLMFKLWSEREAEHRKEMKLEATQNRIFEGFVLSQAQYRNASEGISFTKDQLVSYIQDCGPRGSRLASLLMGRPMSMDPGLAQRLAEVIVVKAAARGILKKDENHSLRERYILTITPNEL